MTFALKIIERLPLSSICSSEEDANCRSLVNWGAFVIAAYAGFSLARACWKGRCKKLTLQDCINNPDRISKLQKAAAGTCGVYLGQDFVLKQCGDQSGFRAVRTKLASSAIQNNNYLHLTIPQVIGIINHEYLAEKRLPICNSEKDAQIVYEKHRDAFTSAVEEFTNLMIRCKFDDIVTICSEFGRYKTPIPRYDNICPYLEKGKGKLGLVDLEHFEEDTHWFSANESFGLEVKYCNQSTCETLIHLFPLHIDEIIRVMQRAGLELSQEDLGRLRLARDDQLAQRRSGLVVILPYRRG